MPYNPYECDEYPIPVCPECERVILENEETFFEYGICKTCLGFPEYCPKCGNRMDGVCERCAGEYLTAHKHDNSLVKAIAVCILAIQVVSIASILLLV